MDSVDRDASGCESAGPRFARDACHYPAAKLFQSSIVIVAAYLLACKFRPWDYFWFANQASPLQPRVWQMERRIWNFAECDVPFTVRIPAIDDFVRTLLPQLIVARARGRLCQAKPRCFLFFRKSWTRHFCLHFNCWFWSSMLPGRPVLQQIRLL